MAMYQDAPEDAIMDDFDAVVFGNHALGHNILGTRESVSRLPAARFPPVSAAKTCAPTGSCSAR